MRTLLLALCLAGCTGSFKPLPYQDLFVEVVWHDVYGETRDPPPVEWISTDGWTIAGQFYDGMTWAGWKVQSACGMQCEYLVENTSLAHELMHMRTFWRTGDVDALHWRGDWQLVDIAEKQAADVVEAQRKIDRAK